ncbi:teichoic acid transport system ATP-binding protein [Breznakia sp. PF5-3]|uniref:ABC transporter ATP-binding protein n=1 Tax=unclassified Breznakia TaxID=2623764 RepID=UPI002406C449|nr:MULTISPECIES: ATP-binding cassette domain-containing protein [unclassified Breznakia]MDF9824849.1 teichoic acid transport system ATP-binding protein [Breznakia sp. PM6-1]MDF9835706.1 teichoic acid transport system ATP-binding protein [Breznakia sp. PF5-3]MDF9838266.1 teichoic acid transport system ATP-binding protein [Breznakia sp. PFB2-8]MDF9860295.1 teichoic acid transport system ATP-binding protein [Breznakia sp. PH5-24]
MNEKYIVEFKNVDKIYKLENKSKRRFAPKKQFYALKDVSFNIKKGSIVGILGTNGSGKSTLSNILAGISSPTNGSVSIRGEQALIAIKAGLNNQLTGLENIKVKGALLGLSKKRIQEITEGVIEFAELGEFLYQPVKKYSSGMKSRLGFSISICLDPDIIIVDEALSVGDKAFAAKCMDKMNELRTTGKTIFFISHSINQIREFCEDGIWIEGGELKAQGKMQEIADLYENYVEDFKKKSKKEQKQFKEELFEERIVK